MGAEVFITRGTKPYIKMFYYACRAHIGIWLYFCDVSFTKQASPIYTGIPKAIDRLCPTQSAIDSELSWRKNKIKSPALVFSFPRCVRALGWSCLSNTEQTHPAAAAPWGLCHPFKAIAGCQYSTFQKHVIDVRAFGNLEVSVVAVKTLQMCFEVMSLSAGNLGW